MVTLPEEIIWKNRKNENIPMHLIIRSQNIYNECVSVSHLRNLILVVPLRFDFYIHAHLGLVWDKGCDSEINYKNDKTFLCGYSFINNTNPFLRISVCNIIPKDILYAIYLILTYQFKF